MQPMANFRRAARCCAALPASYKCVARQRAAEWSSSHRGHVSQRHRDGGFVRLAISTNRTRSSSVHLLRLACAGSQNPSGRLVESAIPRLMAVTRLLPSEGGGHTFESCRGAALSAAPLLEPPCGPI
jgi:hypothetical protein